MIASRHRYGRQPQGCRPAIYACRRPEQTVLYRLVQQHLETYLALAREGDGDGHAVPGYVERELRSYLECGIMAYGFARARCPECGHDFLVAFSCKGRGICPSCNARRMAETAAHLVDHVFPPLPVRQWVLSVPKRLRYFLEREPAAASAVLHIFLRVVDAHLRKQQSGGLGAGALRGGELRPPLRCFAQSSPPLPLLHPRRGIRAPRKPAGSSSDRPRH